MTKVRWTWATTGCDLRWISLHDFDDGPSPLEGNDKKLHINHKRFCIWHVFSTKEVLQQCKFQFSVGPHYYLQGFVLHGPTYVQTQHICMSTNAQAMQYIATQERHYTRWNENKIDHI